jgi:16S rRNA (cytidine1402-2'-O)-methyltransferase
MPLNSLACNHKKNTVNVSSQMGMLYVVATPIGNLDDITLRALKTLNTVDLIAAEDTRYTAVLLAHHNIQTPLVSCHEHNECQRSSQLIKKIERGMSVALVSDAGTPSISDPGYRIVKAVVEKDIRVGPIPGASAALTALSVSGLPTDAFVFLGFPQKKRQRRAEQLRNLAKEKKTIIFYESPRRIISFLEEILNFVGDRYVVLSREMTKYHEEFVRGRIPQVLRILKERPVVKGECTLLVGGYEKEKTGISDTMLDEIRNRLSRQDMSPSHLAKKMAQKYGLPRKDMYQIILRYRSCNENQYSGILSEKEEASHE